MGRNLEALQKEKRRARIRVSGKGVEPKTK